MKLVLFTTVANTKVAINPDFVQSVYESSNGKQPNGTPSVIVEFGPDEYYSVIGSFDDVINRIAEQIL